MKKDKRTQLEHERDEAVEALRMMAFDEDGYDQMVRKVESLQQLVANEKRGKFDKKIRIDPNEMIKLGVSVLELALVLSAEEVRPVLTKAFGLFIRPRV